VTQLTREVVRGMRSKKVLEQWTTMSSERGTQTSLFDDDRKVTEIETRYQTLQLLTF
jgi:hypothetical protein